MFDFKGIVLGKLAVIGVLMALSGGTAAAVPTMSEYAVLALAIALTLSGMLAMRRRRTRR